MADRQQDALDRFWEALAAGRTDGRTDGLPDLDPTLADAVRHLHIADDVDAPSHAFVSRLQEELMLPDTITIPRPVDLAFPIIPNGRDQSKRAIPSFVPALGYRRGRGWLPRLLAAAMILLTLGLAALVFAPDDDPQRLGGIPAVVVPESTSLPEGVTDVESLAEVLMPAGVIAAGARTDLALELHTIPSGTSRKDGLDPTGCCPALHINLVLAGTATLRADGPMLLHPKGGSLEPIVITAGTEAVVGPGDALAYREEVAWTRTVPDGGPLSFLWGVASSGVLGSTGHPDDAHLVGPVSFPTSDYPIRIAEVTLAPGATLHPAPGVVQLYIAATEDARVGELAGNAFKNLSREPVALYVMSVGAVATDAAPSNPEIAASPAASGVTDQATLVELTLPAEMIPAGTELSLTLLAFPASSTTTWSRNDGDCCSGQVMTHVLDGTATFRADAPSYLHRSGSGLPETVPSNSEVSLGLGDTLLHREEGDWELTVTGEVPAVILSSWVGEGIGISDDQSFSAVVDYETASFEPLPPGAYTLRFARLALAVDATLAPGSAVVQLAVAAPDQQARLAQGSGYEVRNLGKMPVMLYALTLTPAAPDAARSIPDIVASPVMASPVAATPEP